jgi:diaminopimelate epimerase
MRFDTDSGRVSARLRGGLPEIDMDAASNVQADAPVQSQAGELRIGFALAGVPHLVVRRGSVADIDIAARGSALRHDPALGAAGANVNFISPKPEGGWLIRTYERGVEGETLACGTGAVAAAILLNVWGESREETRLTTRSGRDLIVRLRRDGAQWLPTLSGEGRLVFSGELATEGET